MEEEVLGGGLAVEEDEFGTVGAQVDGLGGAGQHEGMVEGLDDVLGDDLLELVEVQHHTIVGSIGLVERDALDGDGEMVGVAVDIAALALIAGEGMGHLEDKILGEAEKHEG